MNAAFHVMNGVSTYLFKIFGRAWKEAPMPITLKGDTIIGNDRLDWKCCDSVLN